MKLPSSPTHLVLLGSLPLAVGLFARPSTPQGNVLPTLTAEQAEILSHMRLVQVEDPVRGSLPTLVIEGLNVQIVDGSGATNGNPRDPYSIDPAQVQTNGLGNLILGYNEPGYSTVERTGSHTLVLGIGNSYTSFGGVVSGFANQVRGPHACGLSGTQNTVTGPFAVAVGGAVNEASGSGALAAGGGFNAAKGPQSMVVGGARSLASGAYASVSGGYKSFATGETSSVHGGALNRAQGDFSAVSGGRSRTAPGAYDWVGGSLFEDE